MTAIVRRTLRDHHSRLHTLTNRIISRSINPNSTSYNNNLYSQRIKEDSQRSSSSRYNRPNDDVVVPTTTREDRDRPLKLPIHQQQQQHYHPSTISHDHLCYLRPLPPLYSYQDHHHQQQQLDCYDSASACATSRRHHHHDSVQSNNIIRKHNNTAPLYDIISFSPPFVTTLSTSSSSIDHHHNSNTNRRWYHTTPKHERYTAIVMTLGAVAATAKAGQYAIQAYREWQDHSPSNSTTTSTTASDTTTTTTSNNATDTEFQQQQQQQQQQSHESGNMKDEDTKRGKTTDSGTSSSNNSSSSNGSGSSSSHSGEDGQKRENIFASFFDMAIGSKYYEGGFEEKMTRKEAALILGVRESSTTKRIKEAHRKLLILNHPDTGGSTYLAGKVNEAKELLLKGKKQ